MSKSLVTLFVLFSSLAPLVVQQAPPAAAAAPPRQFKPIVDKFDLKDGDAFVFLGDSITHQTLYTQYVEDFFYTRFPKVHISFHNAGVGGDKCSDALKRFDDDVAAFKPKYVTILLGMNDGRYRDFDKETFDTYQKDMGALLDRIKEIGAIAVPMTPTMHDARTARKASRAMEPRDTYYNGVLALYGAWLREQAQVHGLGFVDMYSPLNNLTLAQRKHEPEWTMIPDAVHPAPTGQVVMAAAVIDDMAAHPPVSAVTLHEDADPAKGAGAINGKVSDVQVTPEKISFTFEANALPWVLPPDAADGYKLVHAGHKFSNEKVTVCNLPRGKYELKIDGQAVGTYGDDQLAFGVELEENQKTPQYQQALKVAMLNVERTAKAMHPLRDQWGARKGKRKEEDWLAAHKDDAEYAARNEAFEKWLAEFKTNVTKLNALVKDYDEKIYQANQPAPHKYELSRVP
jgi:lysophospholipase L1-like esterase